MMKKGTAVFLALLLMMFCLSALAETPVESTEASAAQTVRGQSYSFLFQGSDESGDPVKSEMKLYFVDGGGTFPMPPCLNSCRCCQMCWRRTERKALFMK